MEKLTDVLAMHGFATYVWLAYAITALVMASLAISSLRSLKRATHILHQLQSSDDNET